MDSDDVKQNERETYNTDDDRPEYGALWNRDDLEFLLDIGASNRFWSLLEATTGTTVLDIGYGSGRLVQDIRSRMPDRTAFGIDISERQIKDGYENGTESLLLGDAEQLPFRDATFDIVVVHSALHHMPNWEIVMLAEIGRVLSNGGKLVFYEPERYNPLAAIRRKVLPSTHHTPDEQPFDPSELRPVLEREFTDVTVSDHYLLSNLLPVINNRAPIRIPRSMMRYTYEFEQRLSLEKYSWIFVGKATL